MKALVTGGSGFIGSHLVEGLLACGFDVRCLVRDKSASGWLVRMPGGGVELVQGDCLEPDSIGAAVEGVEYVFHGAGLTKAARTEDFYRANADGAGNVALAAAKAGVAKFVLVSSQAAAGPSMKGVPRREDDLPQPVSDYGISKLMGERRVLAVKDEMDVVVVRPSAVYGPRDRDILEFFRLVSRGIRLSLSGERPISVCHVRDLVDGIMLAAQKPVPSGEVFFIADGRPYTWDELGEAVEVAVGRKALHVVIPVAAMAAYALVSDGLAALTGRPPLLGWQKFAEMRQLSWAVDVSKAKELLGFSASIGFSEGAGTTARWYAENGWL